MKWSWLGLANRIILQWFFIRLAKQQDEVVTEYTMHAVSMMPGGQFSTMGVGKKEKQYWYSIMYWVVPLTGWSTDYIYLNKSKEAEFVNLTKKRWVESGKRV